MNRVVTVIQAFLRRVYLLAIVLALLGGLATVASAQELPTPTPDAEGNILVEAQPNDSLWSIAARAGMTLEELLALNDFAEDVVIQPGDLVIVGRGTPGPTPTVDGPPTATLPPPVPSVTAPPPRTAICLSAFDDRDRNGLHEAEEGLRAGVVFTVYGDDAVIANYITDGVAEPHCIEDLKAGVYHVTRSVGRDEVLTTKGDWALTLVQGTVLQQAFGSYLQSGAGAVTPAPAGAEPVQDWTAPAVAGGTAGMQVETGVQEGGQPSISTALAIAILVLLLASAVLIFAVGYRRYRASHQRED